MHRHFSPSRARRRKFEPPRTGGRGYRDRVLPLLLASLLQACAVPCESASAGPARDACFHRRVAMDPTRWSAEEVTRFAREIEDPIVREATLMLWVREHRGTVADRDRDRVCGLLAGIERNACERRLATAHLAR